MSTSNRGSGSILCAARLIRWVPPRTPALARIRQGVKPEPLLPGIAGSGLDASALHRKSEVAEAGGSEMSEAQVRGGATQRFAQSILACWRQPAPPKLLAWLRSVVPIISPQEAP